MTTSEQLPQAAANFSSNIATYEVARTRTSLGDRSFTEFGADIFYP